VTKSLIIAWLTGTPREAVRKGSNVTYGVGTPKARAVKMCPNSCSGTHNNKSTTKSRPFQAMVAPLDA
jgi:hypothetical protein